MGRTWLDPFLFPLLISFIHPGCPHLRLVPPPANPSPTPGLLAASPPCLAPLAGAAHHTCELHCCPCLPWTLPPRVAVGVHVIHACQCAINSTQCALAVPCSTAVSASSSPLKKLQGATSEPFFFPIDRRLCLTVLLRQSTSGHFGRIISNHLALLLHLRLLTGAPEHRIVIANFISFNSSNIPCCRNTSSMFPAAVVSFSKNLSRHIVF